MTGHFKRSLCALLLIALMPAAGHAQFGGLKKKLKERAGLEKTEERAPASQARPKVTQWKAGERIEPLTAASLEQFIQAVKSEQAYNAMTVKERERADAQKAVREQGWYAKREQRNRCMQEATVEIMIAAQERMQQRVMELAQAGDANPAEKAGKEMMDGVSKLVEKKCGPEMKDIGESERVNYKVAEWLCAYVGARQEMDPAAAAAAVLATESEGKMLETNLARLREVCGIK